MKRKIFIFVIIACFIHVFALSQNVLIQGYVYDSLSKEPVEQLEIILNDHAGKALTNQNGYFSLTVSALPCSLQLRNMSYKTKDVVISKNQSIFSFILSSKTYDLKTVEISTNVPVQVMPNKHYHMMDYEFYGDKILALAFENQSFLTPVLLLLNLEGDTLARLEVAKPLKICKDFTGKVYLYTKTTAWAINYDSTKLFLSDPVNIEDFDAINNVIIAQSGTHYYLKHFFSCNQEVDYYNYEEVNDTLKFFKAVIDEKNIRSNIKGFTYDGKEENLRFQQMVMLRPVYAPLVCIKDTLVLFNFTASEIEKFTASAIPIDTCKLDFRPDRSFKDELLIDEKEAKAYFLFRKNGFSELKQIDLKSGKIVQTIPIPSFVFVEKIKVHDNVVYFLYKEKINEEYKKLYKLRI